MEYVYYDAKRNFKISTLKWSISAMMLKGIVKISTLKWIMSAIMLKGIVKMSTLKWSMSHTPF